MTKSSTSDPRPRGWRRKIWRRRLRIAIRLSPLLAVAWAYYFLDSFAPDDSDLRPPVVRVPDEQNGLVLLGKAIAEIRWPSDPPADANEADPEENAQAEDHVPPPSKADRLDELAHGYGDWDSELVREVLELNRNVLETFGRALEMEQFAWEPITDPQQSNLGAWRRARQFSVLQLLFVRDREVARSGAEALRETLNLICLGHRLEEARGPIVNFLVASTFSILGRQALIRIAGSDLLGLEDLRNALRGLERFRPTRDALRSTLQSEYVFQGLMADAIARGDIPDDEPDLGIWATPVGPIWPWRSRPFFLPNHFKGLAATLCRDILEAFPPGPPWRSVPWQRSLDLAPNPWLPIRNGIGRHGVSSTVGAYRGLVGRWQLNCIEFELTRIAVALKGFRVVHGRLPEKLDELVSGWIAAVPKDPFDNQPFRYDRARRVLWSIGNDQKDTGGTFEPDPDSFSWQSDVSEPLLKLPFE